MTRVITVIGTIQAWLLADTVSARRQDFGYLLQAVFHGANQLNEYVATWTALTDSLPADMTLEELSLFLSADNDGDRRSILDTVNQRLGAVPREEAPQPKRIRMLTMHGEKV